VGFLTKIGRLRTTMKTVLLADDRAPDVPRARRCRLRDRVRARFGAFRLDRALAAGASPDSGVLLSLRAETLMSMDNRQGLAQALRRVVADAARPLFPMGPVLPLARRDIRRHRNLIYELADVLDRGLPVDLRGLAAVEVLLKDGAGPLYTANQGDALGARLRAALNVLSAPPAGSAVA
jgi:hypothetical protein